MPALFMLGAAAAAASVIVDCRHTGNSPAVLVVQSDPFSSTKLLVPGKPSLG